MPPRLRGRGARQQSQDLAPSRTVARYPDLASRPGCDEDYEFETAFAIVGSGFGRANLGDRGGSGGGIARIAERNLAIVGGVIPLNGAAGSVGVNSLGCGGGMGGGAVRRLSTTANLGVGLVSASGAAGGAAHNNSALVGGAGGSGRVAVGAPQVTGSATPFSFQG